jgi:hypothetical protein
MRRLRIFAMTVIYAGKIFFVSGITKVILKLSLSVAQYLLRPMYMKCKLEVVAEFCGARLI